MALDRRSFLMGSAAAAASLPWLPACAGPGWQPRPGNPFHHGVASGDPLADRVILWTRVSPSPDAAQPIPVRWSVARDPAMTREVANGRTVAGPLRDHTVKVDATALSPGTSYFYRFSVLDHDSPVGRTRTLPSGSLPRASLALCSGSNIAFGYFNAYALLARRADLDAVLHLGDYLYEYADGTYGDGAPLGRIPQPDREIVTLADYRARHAQYKRDPDLQEVHRQHPFIAIWDDHEIAKGAWKGGARNHQPDEGPWDARWQNAVRAYLEWMPIREVVMDRPARAYRRFRFGNLVDLMMLETRLERDRRVSDPGDRSALHDPARSMLGAQQEEWLLDLLSRSKSAGIAWRVVGQQTLFGQLLGEKGVIRNADAWDGYPLTRGRILDHIEHNGIDDTVVVGGDLNSSWALDLSRDPFSREVYDPASGRGSLAVEFLTPGVTSPALQDSGEAARVAARTLALNPHVKWVDLFHRGYALLDVDRERVQCEWYHLDTVTERKPGEHFAGAFFTRRGRNHLEPAQRRSRPRRPAPPLAP